jgi:hypothetical protein
MGNRLFQEARQAVEVLKNAEGADAEHLMAVAKNAISSAYANTTIAEQHQLTELQKEIDKINIH